MELIEKSLIGFKNERLRLQTHTLKKIGLDEGSIFNVYLDKKNKIITIMPCLLPGTEDGVIWKCGHNGSPRIGIKRSMIWDVFGRGPFFLSAYFYPGRLILKEAEREQPKFNSKYSDEEFVNEISKNEEKLIGSKLYEYKNDRMRFALHKYLVKSTFKTLPYIKIIHEKDTDCMVIVPCNKEDADSKVVKRPFDSRLSINVSIYICREIWGTEECFVNFKVFQNKVIISKEFVRVRRKEPV